MDALLENLIRLWIRPCNFAGSFHENNDIMRKSLIILVAIFVSINTYAQEFVGFVFSEDTFEPVKYANIHLINSNRGTYVDENGRFSLNLNSIDTIHISSIGFVERFLETVNFDSGDTIFLKSQSYNIPEIRVSDRTKTLTERFGYIKDKTILYHVFPAYDWGTEFTCFIQNPNINPGKVVEVAFKAKEGKAESVIRLHIYQPLENGYPGEELLQEDIILSSSDISKGKLLVDVSAHDIICSSSGLFVGLELIGYKGYQNVKNNIKDKSNNIIEIGLSKSGMSKCYTKFIFDENAQWERVYNSSIVLSNFGDALTYQVELQTIELEQ